MGLIVCAGMPRSGSTWMYNVVRLAYKLSGVEVGAGWIQNYNRYRKFEIVILKTHFHLPPKPPEFLFYTYRDLRDVIASYKRQSGRLFSINKIRNIVCVFDYWKSKSNYNMRYESMINNPEEVIDSVIDILKIRRISARQVKQAVEKLDPPSEKNRWNKFDQVNLLHPGHITDGGIGTWSNLEPNLIRCIEKEFKQWFIDNDYVLTNEF